MAPRGLSLDIGCGFRDINTPMLVDVSLDLNLDRASPQFLSRLKNPLIADVERIPLRDGVFFITYCISVLEHLPNPFNAIREERRVLIEKGAAFNSIPISVAHEPQFIKSLFLEFPFSLFSVLGYIRRHDSYMSIRGSPHVSNIKPEHITPFFRESEINFIYGPHRWFVRRWGSFFKRVLGRAVRGRKHKYLIRCIK